MSAVLRALPSFIQGVNKKYTVGAARGDLQCAEALTIVVPAAGEPDTPCADVGVCAAVALPQVARHLVDREAVLGQPAAPASYRQGL